LNIKYWIDEMLDDDQQEEIQWLFHGIWNG
jgi:hypothetical protein